MESETEFNDLETILKQLKKENWRHLENSFHVFRLPKQSKITLRTNSNRYEVDLVDPQKAYARISGGNFYKSAEPIIILGATYNDSLVSKTVQTGADLAVVTKDGPEFLGRVKAYYVDLRPAGIDACFLYESEQAKFLTLEPKPGYARAWCNHPSHRYCEDIIDKQTFNILKDMESEFDIFILDRGEVNKANHVGKVLIGGAPAYRRIGSQVRSPKKARESKGDHLTSTQYKVLMFALKNPGATMLQYLKGCFGVSEQELERLSEVRKQKKRTRKQEDFHDEVRGYRGHIGIVSTLLNERLDIVLRGAGEGKYHFRDPETNNPIHDSKSLKTCVLKIIEVD